jgi:hypothetical protein
VAAWTQDMGLNFFVAKNHEIANNSTTAYAIEKMNSDLELFAI